MKLNSVLKFRYNKNTKLVEFDIHVEDTLVDWYNSFKEGFSVSDKLWTDFINGESFIEVCNCNVDEFYILSKFIYDNTIKSIKYNSNHEDFITSTGIIHIYRNFEKGFKSLYFPSKMKKFIEDLDSTTERELSYYLNYMSL